MIKHKEPIVALMDILGKKWVMRILWELHQKPCTFRELQTKCGEISPTVVNARIKDLCAANLVKKMEPSGYGLTKYGEELLDLFEPMKDFALKWMEDMEREG
jgi:DNA-binding HxlR family transcriptional regulator